MRAEIPARRHFDIECKTLENIVYEVTLDKTKWLIYAIYRPPSMANDIFTNHMNILLDKGSKFIENYMVYLAVYTIWCITFNKCRYHMMTITDSSIKIKCLKTKIVFISKYNIY
jgi:hypothetical protein